MCVGVSACIPTCRIADMEEKRTEVLNGKAHLPYTSEALSQKEKNIRNGHSLSRSHLKMLMLPSENTNNIQPSESCISSHFSL